jgi:hypothetical protein
VKPLTNNLYWVDAAGIGGSLRGAGICPYLGRSLAHELSMEKSQGRLAAEVIVATGHKLMLGTVRRCGRTRMGGWAVAQSPILRTTITLERLRKRGYQSLREHYFKVSPLLNEPPYTRSGTPSPYVRWCEAACKEAHRGLMAHGRLLDWEVVISNLLVKIQ